MGSLPNLLSVSRLASAVLLLAVALAHLPRTLFLALLGGALLTDVLDGYLARRLGAESDLGRKLDSWADHALLAAGFAGFCLLWPEVLRSEWPWFAAGIAADFAVGVYTLLRWRVLPGYHTWTSKVLAVALAPALALLLAGSAAWPFHLVVAVAVLGGLESLAIAVLLPGFSGEVPTGWHAWRRRLPPPGSGWAPPSEGVPHLQVGQARVGPELAARDEPRRSRAARDEDAGLQVHLVREPDRKVGAQQFGGVRQ